MPAKVTLCATVTTKVMREIAIRRGGARDIIDVCRLLKGKGEISQFATVRMLARHYNSLLNSSTYDLTDAVDITGKALFGGRPVSMFEEARLILEGIRRDTKNAVDMFSDISWDDIFQAAAFRARTIAEIQNLPQGCIVSAIFGSTTKFQVVISSNSEGLANMTTDLIAKAAESNCCFTHFVSLTNFGAMQMIAAKDITGPSGLGIALQS